MPVQIVEAQDQARMPYQLPFPPEARMEIVEPLEQFRPSRNQYSFCSEGRAPSCGSA
jgi:hypothetical protein